MRPHPEATKSQRTARYRLHRAAGWLLSLLAAAGGAANAAEPRDESEHWAPSFALFFDALGQKADGSVTTGPVLGPPLDPFDVELDAEADGSGCIDTRFVPPRSGQLCPSARKDPAQILPDSADGDTSVEPLVGGSLELMTPSLLDGWLRPRLFVRGDAAAAFSFERNLAGLEAPGEFERPEDADNIADNRIEELSVRGQGSRARMQVRRVVLSAGGGIAFSLDLFERRIRIKPSFEYLHYELDLLGVVHRAVRQRSPTGTADLSGFRLISLTRVEKERYDGIGPGLELEVDTAQLGPLQTSVYIMGRGYHLFGDLKTTFSATNEFGESATWTFDPEPWVWRSGVGFRLRWLPEPE